jgi:hypothetical protein
MASVGGVSCDYLYGEIPSLKQLTEVYHRPGMNGVGVRKMGSGEGAFQLRAVTFDTEANIVTWIAAVEALVGTIVTVVDVWSDNKTNCLIESVTPAGKQSIVASGSDDCMGEINIAGRVVT